jgi:hypothetical protein
LTYCILRAGKPKFQPVEAAAAAAEPVAAAALPEAVAKPAAAAANAVVEEVQEQSARITRIDYYY